MGLDQQQRHGDHRRVERVQQRPRQYRADEPSPRLPSRARTLGEVRGMEAATAVPGDAVNKAVDGPRQGAVWLVALSCQHCCPLSARPARSHRGACAPRRASTGSWSNSPTPQRAAGRRCRHPGRRVRSSRPCTAYASGACASAAIVPYVRVPLRLPPDDGPGPADAPCRA
jgi:hypothetical protein